MPVNIRMLLAPSISTICETEQQSLSNPLSLDIDTVTLVRIALGLDGQRKKASVINLI
jgi:hypothetical protein